MKLLALFIKALLVLCFVFVFFLTPVYLLAIYPDVPEPALPIRRGWASYGIIKAQPSIETFIYRLLGCGIMMALGALLAYKWFEGIPRRVKDV